MKPVGVSYGAFINVTAFDVDSWRSQMSRVDRLPGRDHVEVWLERVPRDRKQRKLLRRLLAGETVIVHAPFIGLSLVAPWKALRRISFDRLLRSIEVSSDLNAKVLTIHPGDAPVMEPRAAMTDRFVTAYADLQDRAGSLLISVENMPSRNTVTQPGITSTLEFANLLRRSPNMKFTLDVGHALQNGDDYVPFLLTNAASIANVHLHDGINGGRAHLPLGAGDFDADCFFSSLMQSGFAGYVSLETLNFEDTLSSWSTVLKYADGCS